MDEVDASSPGAAAEITLPRSFLDMPRWWAEGGEWLAAREGSWSPWSSRRSWRSPTARTLTRLTGQRYSVALGRADWVS